MNKPEFDQDLVGIVKGKLYDICSIEFDFVPLDNSIQFNYQFGSDEYPEYVDSPYNDVFAFIISDGNRFSESGEYSVSSVPLPHRLVSIPSLSHSASPRRKMFKSALSVRNRFLGHSPETLAVVNNPAPTESLCREQWMTGDVVRGWVWGVRCTTELSARFTL